MNALRTALASVLLVFSVFYNAWSGGGQPANLQTILSFERGDLRLYSDLL